MTEATPRACSESGPRRANRWATTSRTLLGRPRASRSTESTHRPSRVLDEGAGLGQVPDHLDQEERIATGLAAEGMGERHTFVLHVVARRRGQQVDDLGVRQSRQVEAVDRRLAAQFGQRPGQRVGAGEILLAEGSHHQHGHGRGRGDQVAQQLQTGGVHPVQVVEHQDQRSRR